MHTFSPALAIVAAAKMRADEQEKKGGPELSTLPPVGDAMAPPAPVSTQAFPTGTLVRDILSGTTGVVVDPPLGDFGDLVFVKCDQDQQTYPMRSDQLEVLPVAAPAPMVAPVPEAMPAPEAATASEAAAAEAPPTEEGAKPKASLKAARLDPSDIPAGYAVQPLKPGQPAKDKLTCENCGLSWDDANVTSMTPAPSGRCPFECFHKNLDARLKPKGGIKRLPSGRWKDTNGNSYATVEEAAEAEAWLHVDDKLDEDSPEAKSQHEAAVEEILSGVKGSILRQEDRVSHPKAAKTITYGMVLEAAKPTITASKLLAFFGYVPKHWDRIIAALQKDGVTVLRANAAVDVKAMLAKGMNAQEIITDACAKNGPVLKATLQDLRKVAIEAAKIADNKAKAQKIQAMPKREQRMDEGVAEDEQLAGTDDEESYTWFGNYGNEITMSLEDAKSCSGPGPADDNVKALSERKDIATQIAKWKPESLVKELGEYGAWDDAELKDHALNIQRMLWIACGDISENPDTYKNDSGVDGSKKLNAAKPTKPMPTEKLGAGMAWVWDDLKKDWFATTLTAAKTEKKYW